MNRYLIYWIPRCISILATLVTSCLSVLAVSEQNEVTPLLITLAVAMILTVIGSVKYPVIGMVMWAVFGITSIVVVNGEGNDLYYGLVVFPMFLTGFLYCVDWYQKQITP